MKNRLIIVLLTFLGCFLSRLVFVNSNVFFFDGDEAIVALMGLDVLDGNFPLYFYGQNYGLSIIEALLVSIGVLIFGTTMLAVKIPMLLLWSSGVSLMALTLFRLAKENKAITLLFIAVLILSPTWLVWSMKARGGYLTSFFFVSLVLFLLVQFHRKGSLPAWIGVGISIALIYEAQPIWLPCLLPIIGYYQTLSTTAVIFFYLHKAPAHFRGATNIIPKLHPRHYKTSAVTSELAAKAIRQSPGSCGFSLVLR